MYNLPAELNAKTVREIFDCDLATGVLTWARSYRGKIVKGAIVGGDRGDGRHCFSFRKKRFYVYRVVWLYAHGEWPKHEIDHINGDTSDNRLANLRDVLPKHNQQNHHRPAKTKIRNAPLGVSWCNTKKAWRASITIDRRAKTIGYFDDPGVAHSAYVNEKRKLHPFGTL